MNTIEGSHKRTMTLIWSVYFAKLSTDHPKPACLFALPKINIMLGSHWQNLSSLCWCVCVCKFQRDMWNKSIYWYTSSSLEKLEQCVCQFRRDMFAVLAVLIPGNECLLPPTLPPLVFITISSRASLGKQKHHIWKYWNC